MNIVIAFFCALLLLGQYVPTVPATHTGGGGTTSFTFVKAAAGTGGGSTTATVAITPTNTGDNLVAGCVWATSSAGRTGVTCTCSDSQSLTWTTDTSTLKVFDTTTHYAEMGVEFCHSTTTTTATTSDTVTCTFHNQSIDAFDYCWVIEGTAVGSFGLDQTNAATGTSTTPSGGSITPTASTTVGVASFSTDNGNGGNQCTAGSGWTKNLSTGVGNADVCSEQQQLSSLSAVTGNFTDTTSGQWVANVANYK